MTFWKDFIDLKGNFLFKTCIFRKGMAIGTIFHLLINKFFRGFFYSRFLLYANVGFMVLARNLAPINHTTHDKGDGSINKLKEHKLKEQNI